MSEILIDDDAGVRIITLNRPDRLNALIPPTVINQLRVFAGLLQFRL